MATWEAERARQGYREAVLLSPAPFVEVPEPHPYLTHLLQACQSREDADSAGAGLGLMMATTLPYR